MKTQVKPGVAVLAILATIGIAVAIMFAIADQRQPHLPNGPSAAMRAGRAAQSRTSPGKKAPPRPGTAGAAGAGPQGSPTARKAPPTAAAEDASRPGSSGP